MDTKKLTILAMLLTYSIIISIIEANFIILPIYGAKLGLANIVTIFVLYKYGIKDAALLLLTRILLVSILRGTLLSTSFYFSLTGGIISLLLSYIAYKTNLFSIIGIGIIGAVGHTIGQVFISIILTTVSMITLLPYLLLIAIITGIGTGYIALKLYNRIENPRTES